LILWHGCPEFWLVWRKNILPLAESFDVVVPEVRRLADALGVHEEAGQFVCYERPALANREILEFFRKLR
jgi:hypothetical protein